MKRVFTLIITCTVLTMAQNFYNQYGGHIGTARNNGYGTSYYDQYGGNTGRAVINSDGSVNYYDKYGGYQGRSY